MVNSRFSHIYIEKGIEEYPDTERILAHFPEAERIRIDNYKDVFNRKGQEIAWQHRFQALVLARKEAPFFYAGAPVCQSFGHENFYYCSLMRGCVYDCSYCYLKGMYPSGHMVAFVNPDDYFADLEALLREREVYLCISYDCDLLAMEPVTGYVGRWAAFAAGHAGLTVEVRTKCARTAMWDELPSVSNVVYAFTVAPQAVIDQNERSTPPVRTRIQCLLEGLRRGFPMRLCFDPMLYVPEWKRKYGALLEELDEAFAGAGVSMRSLTDVSVGCFRISQEYMKKLRRAEPLSATVQYPFVNEGGVYRYPAPLEDEMEAYLVEELARRVGRENIFCDRPDAG